jgi:NRPS condensation-like uncharacterized protein
MVTKPDIEAQDSSPRTPAAFPCQKADTILLAGRSLGLVFGIIQMEMEFAAEIDAERLVRAIELLLDMHPILSCTLVSNSFRQYWERTGQKMDAIFLQTQEKQEYDMFRNSSLDPYTGPLIRLCLWQRPEGCNLLLKVCHEISDAGGVKEIALDLASIYTRLEKDPEYRPVPEFKGSRACWQAILHVPLYKYPELVLEFFKSLWSSFVPGASLTLPLPIDKAPEMTYIIRHLSPEAVSRVAEYGRKRKATLNDMMVAAFYRALAKEGKWDRNSHLRLQVTVDMRRYLPTGRPEALCNLSAMAYPYLGLDLGDDFEATLERVRGIMRRLKDNWIGMPMLLVALPLLSVVPQKLIVKMLGSAMMQGISQGRTDFPPFFTNMGPIRDESLAFGEIKPEKAWLLPPLTCPPVFFTGMSGYSGSLTLSSGLPLSSKPIAEKFLDEILAQLPA